MNEGAGPQAEPPSEAPGRALRPPIPAPTLTYAILGITVVMYVLQIASFWLFGVDWLEYFGARFNPAIRAGELWRLVTPALLHASPPHILFNMYALASFGAGLERQFGRTRFFMLYVLSAFAGNALSFFFSNDYAHSVGASTAVFGLVAAEGAFLYQNRRLFGRQFGGAIGNIIFVVAINLAFGSLTAGIDNWGHIGGMLGGLIFAWFAGPLLVPQGEAPEFRLVDRREPRDVITGAGTVLVIFGVLVVWGILAPVGR